MNLFNSMFGKDRSISRSVKSIRGRQLRLESLESRELLSVNLTAPLQTDVVVMETGGTDDTLPDNFADIIVGTRDAEKILLTDDVTPDTFEFEFTGEAIDETEEVGETGSDDVDLFQLDIAFADLGKDFNFTVTYDTPVVLINDPFLRLFNEDGKDISGDYGFASGTFTPDIAGTYFIGVSGVGNEIYDVTDGTDAAYSADFEAYTFHVVRDDTNPPADLGDTISDVTSPEAVIDFTGGNTFTITSLIGNGSYGEKDVDMFELTVAAGKTYTFDVEFIEGTDTTEVPALRLFESDGTPVADFDGTFIGTTDNAGTYYLGVSTEINMNYDPVVADSGTDGGFQGTYTLNVEQNISTPTDFAVTSQTDVEIVVEWTKVTNATGYTVSWGTNATDRTDWESDNTLLDVDTATINEFGTNPLVAGTTYYFVITATDGTDTSDEAGPITGQVNALADPTGLDVAGVTNESVTLIWDEATNPLISGYTVSWKLESADDVPASWTDVPVTGGDADGVTIDGLAAKTLYSFKIMANAVGGGGSNAVDFADAETNAIADPVVTVAGKTATSVTLSWTAPVGLDPADLEGYILQYVKTADYGPPTPWITVTDPDPLANPADPFPAADATGFTITGLDPTVGYTFALTALSADGDSNGAEVATTLNALPATPDNFILDVANPATAMTVSFTWDAPSPAPTEPLTGYVLYYTDTPGDPLEDWDPVVIAADAISYKLTGLDENTPYSFVLVARDANGDSAPTTPALTATTTPLGTPDAPVLALDSKTATSVTLKWDAQDDLDGYTLIYTDDATKSETEWTTWTGTIGALDSEVTVTGLTPELEYTFILTASNDVDDVDSARFATTTNALPATPTNLVASDITASSMKLTWDPGAADLSGYKLVYSATPTVPESWIEVTGLTGASVSADIAGLAETTPYTFRLSAIDANGTSIANEKVFTTNANPLAPTGFEATAKTATTMTLKWDTVASVSAYTLTYVGLGAPVTVPLTPEDAAGYTITSLNPTTEYTLLLTATDANGTSIANEIKVTTNALPATPTGFEVDSKTATSVVLKWDEGTDLSGYSLRYIKTADLGGLDPVWTPVEGLTGDATGTTISGLAASTDYTFELIAIDANGISADNTFNESTNDLPDEPTGLIASAQTATTITLQWNAGTDLTGYTLRYKATADVTDDEIEWTVVNITDGTATGYKVEGLDPSTSYTFNLSAIDDNGASSEISRALSTVALAIPATPTGFDSTAVTAKTVSLGWDAQDDVASYTLKFKAADATDWSTWQGAILGSATSVTVTGLQATTDYEFELVAVNTAGTSAAAEAEATTIVAAPQEFASTAQTANTVTLTWVIEDTPDSYKLEWRVPGGTWADVAAADNPAATALTATVTGLAAAGNYEFRLTATKNAIDSTQEIATAATKIAAFLGDFTSTVQTEDSATLTWTWSDTVNDPDSYTLQFREWTEDGSEDWNIATAPAVDALTATVTGLDAYTKYEFRLVATVGGFDSAAVTTEATTMVATPTSFASSAQTGKTVTLTWDLAEDVDTYTLRYKVTTDDSADAWKVWEGELTGEDASVKVTDLTPETGYTFELTANIGDDASAVALTTASTIALQLPATPAGFGSTAVTATSVSLGWTAMTDLNGYTFRYKADADTEWTNWPTMLAADAVSVQVTGLTPETDYTFELYAVNDDGASATGASETATTDALAKPAEPTGFASTGTTTTTVSLKWDTHPDVDGYVLTYQETAVGGEVWTEWDGEMGDGIATVTGLKSGTAYTFQLVATNSVGQSDPAAANATTVVLVKPATPTTFICTGIATTTLSFTWDTPADVDEYILTYQETAVGGDEWTTWDGEMGEGSATVTGLNPGTDYTFRLVAKNAAGSSDPATQTATTNVLVKPVKPVDFKAASQTMTTVTLGWEAQDDVAGYVLRYKATTADEWTTWQGTITGDATEVTVTGLERNTAYTFELTARNAVGDSDAASTTAITELKPSTPDVTGTYQDADKSVLLTWDDVDGADYYQVWRWDGVDMGSLTTIGRDITGNSFVDDDPPLNGTAYYVVKSAVTVDPKDIYSDAAMVSVVTAAEVPAPVVTATFDADTGVTLNWDEVAGADAYKVYRYTYNSADDTWEWVTISEKFFSGTEFVDADGTATTTYGVRAYIGTVFSAMTRISVTPAVKPAAPKDFKAEVLVDDTVELTWTAVADADTYQIWRWDVAKQDWVTVASNITGTSYTDANPELGSGTYIIKAQNAAGNSELASTSTLTDKPTAPAGFTATVVDDVVNLSWDAVDGADYYQVWRWDVIKNDWVTIGRTVTGLTCVDTQPERGNGVYLVKGVNGLGFGDVSTVATFGRPETPVVAADYVGGTNVDLSWAAVPAATNYRIWRRVDGQSWTEVSSIATIAETEYTDTAAPEGETVYYMVRAYIVSLFSDFVEVSVDTIVTP